MKITLENTDRIVTLQIDGNDVPARLWEGHTEAGVKVIAFITRISPQSRDSAVKAVFEHELQETRQPTLEPFAMAIDIRMIL